jgi:hypothetical protein
LPRSSLLTALLPIAYCLLFFPADCRCQLPLFFHCLLPPASCLPLFPCQLPLPTATAPFFAPCFLNKNPGFQTQGSSSPILLPCLSPHPFPPPNKSPCPPSKFSSPSVFMGSSPSSGYSSMRPFQKPLVMGRSSLYLSMMALATALARK